MRVGNNIGDEALIGGKKYVLIDKWKNADNIDHEIFLQMGTLDERTVIIAVRDGDLKNSVKYWFDVGYATDDGPLVTRYLAEHDLAENFEKISKLNLGQTREISFVYWREELLPSDLQIEQEEVDSADAPF